MEMYDRNLPWLGSTMQAHGIDLPVPVCVFCGCDDLRVGGQEVATFVACPQCGADGPIGRGLFVAVQKYLTLHKMENLDVCEIDREQPMNKREATSTDDNLESLWQEYCDASKSIGELPGGVEEYDVDAMNDAAHALYQFTRCLYFALDDCAQWMSTREKMIPGLERLCDRARNILSGTNQ